MSDSADKTARTPDVESMHRDVAFANTFRLEVIKTMLAICTALLAFTISFRPTLSAIEWESALILGWAGLAISIMSGLGVMFGWERYYISYRDHDWHGDRDGGRSTRHLVNEWRRLAALLQWLGFIVGVSGVAAFAVRNVAHVVPGS
jgi:hypothetical protein